MAAGINPRVTPLAGVSAGWTGTVTVTVGAVTSTYDVLDRESALSVMDVVQRRAVQMHGGSWTWWVSTASKIEIVASTVFSIAVTGTALARLGMTGTVSGSNSYTFPNAYNSAVLPDYGLKYRAAAVLTEGGEPVSDGTFARGGHGKSREVQMVIFDDIADLLTIQTSLIATRAWDVWLDGGDTDYGRLDRFRLTRSTIRRWGRAATNARLVCRAQGVL